MFENMKQLRRTAPRVTAAHVNALKALAHEGRLRAFFHLVRARRDVAAGDLAEALDVPAPTLSHQLDQLTRAGLLARRREERHVYYAVRRDAVTPLVRLLTACC